jgi:hypothetical protein
VRNLDKRGRLNLVRKYPVAPRHATVDVVNATRQVRPRLSRHDSAWTLLFHYVLPKLEAR